MAAQAEYWSLMTMAVNGRDVGGECNEPRPNKVRRDLLSDAPAPAFFTSPQHSEDESVVAALWHADPNAKSIVTRLCWIFVLQTIAHSVVRNTHLRS